MSAIVLPEYVYMGLEPVHNNQYNSTKLSMFYASIGVHILNVFRGLLHVYDVNIVTR